MRPLLTEDNKDNLSTWEPKVEVLDAEEIKR